MTVSKFVNRKETPTARTLFLPPDDIILVLPLRLSFRLERWSS